MEACYDELSSVVARFHVFKRGTRFAEKFLLFIFELMKYDRIFYANNFFSHTSWLWDTLVVSCFPVNFYLQKFE